MAIILATVSGPREVETFLKIFVSYKVYIYVLYRLLNCFENPRNAFAKHRYILQLKNPLNVAVVQKSAKAVLGRFSPHSSPSRLPGKTFCLHFCDTVVGF
jgi:hypothetical protein